MKKQFLAIVIALLIILCACTSSVQPPRETLPPETTREDKTMYVVENPMPYPDYTFDATPSSDDLRKTVVQATRDLLSIQWSTAKNIAYNKSGPVSNKRFKHMADTTYAGTPYSNGSTGIFQFFEFYDPETGRLWYPGTSAELSRNLGNSCADSVIWGYNTVCNSLSGGYYPATMVYANGYYPVGSYSYDFSVTSYNKCPTNTILKENGTDVIVDAYTRVQMGDALVSTPDNHAMMAIENATVVYLEDGSIDIAESYIMIQDQRGGHGAGFYEHTENGKLIQYSGRTSAKYTFKQLLDKAYLPVTPAELMGFKDYEKATVTATAENCGSIEELLGVTVTSNYPMAVLNVIVVDGNGNQQVIERLIFGGSKKEGPPRSYDLSELESLTTYSSSAYPKQGCTIKIEVVASTGERFIPVTAELN